MQAQRVGGGLKDGQQWAAMGAKKRQTGGAECTGEWQMLELADTRRAARDSRCGTGGKAVWAQQGAEGGHGGMQLGGAGMYVWAAGESHRIASSAGSKYAREHAHSPLRRPRNGEGLQERGAGAVVRKRLECG